MIIQNGLFGSPLSYSKRLDQWAKRPLGRRETPDRLDLRNRLQLHQYSLEQLK